MDTQKAGGVVKKFWVHKSFLSDSNNVERHGCVQLVLASEATATVEALEGERDIAERIIRDICAAFCVHHPDRVISKANQLRDQLTQATATVEEMRGAAERMAQELGWPGYSQGGNPVSYIYDRATEQKAALR